MNSSETLRRGHDLAPQVVELIAGGSSREGFAAHTPLSVIVEGEAFAQLQFESFIASLLLLHRRLKEWRGALFMRKA